jgi:hypothetical protein
MTSPEAANGPSKATGWVGYPSQYRFLLQLAAKKEGKNATSTLVADKEEEKRGKSLLPMEEHK